MSSSSEPKSETYWTELRIFLQVAHAGSFNKAAEQLGLSHPTVGRAVRRLEQELGTQLIAEAFARGIKLTPTGKRLSRKLSSIDCQLAVLLQRLQ